MKVAEIRKLSTTELTTKALSCAKKSLNAPPFTLEKSKITVIRAKRKDLARMLTVLSEALIKEAN